MTCSIEGCDGKIKARGWCLKHYKRWRKHGDPHVTDLRGDSAARFWAKVDITSTCWEWVGRLNDAGYGVFSLGSRRVRAHRWAYEEIVGPIPDGLTLDHLCRNRRCVNPSHLEPVTLRANTLRGEAPAAKNARKTTCPKGHLLVPDPYRRGRHCPECLKQRQADYYRRRSDARQTANGTARQADDRAGAR